MLFLMRRYDKGFRYWADVSNVGNRMTIDYLLHPAGAARLQRLRGAHHQHGLLRR
jgi:hypothetical protein